VIWVRLSRSDIARAIAEGHRRYAARRRTNSKQRYEMPDELAATVDPWSAQAECAFAVAMHTEWNPSPYPDAEEGDVLGWHISATKHAGGHLLVYEDDPDHRRLALVLVDSPWFSIVGGIIARAGKWPGWWSERLRWPAYKVPQENLWPIADGGEGFA
jgi:hypothetical protein